MPSQPSLSQQIERAIEILRQGGIVAFSTDTVYGLGGDASSEEAVRRVFRVKRRPPNLALPLLVAGCSDLASVAAEVPESAWRLAERFLPGGLTLVLKKGPAVLGVVAGEGGTVAVRVPDHPVPLALIEGLPGPIIGTSANVSGAPSPVTAQEVREQLGEGVDLVIDGGRCPGGVESTVVDVSGAVPQILREGAIPREEIEKVLGPLC